MRKFSSGFTIIEVLVALAIFAIVMGISTPLFTQFLQRQRLMTESNRLAALIEQTRLNSQSVSGGEAHGLKFSPQYVEVLPENRRTAFRYGVFVETSAPLEIFFQKLSGELEEGSAPQVILLRNSAFQRQFTILPSGILEVGEVTRR